MHFSFRSNVSCSEAVDSFRGTNNKYFFQAILCCVLPKLESNCAVHRRTNMLGVDLLNLFVQDRLLQYKVACMKEFESWKQEEHTGLSPSSLKEIIKPSREKCTSFTITKEHLHP